MSTIVTERCILPLNPDADIEDPSSHAGVVFQNLLNLVKKQPGFLSGLWARRIGETNDVEQLVGKSIDLFACETRRMVIEKVIYGVLFVSHSCLLSRS